jgi:hypothetical protein
VDVAGVKTQVSKMGGDVVWSFHGSKQRSTSVFKSRGRGEDFDLGKLGGGESASRVASNSRCKFVI